MKLNSTAAVFPPLSLPQNVQLARLCRALHNRKNWLFAGNNAAGQATAVLFTLIASAQRHGLDPQRYLTSVFAKIASTHLSELEQFLPDVWKKELQAEATAAAAANPALPQA